MLSPRTLVRGNPARAKFAAENSQVIIKVSTQNTKKQNNQIALLSIINDKKLLYKN